jgi:predicted membrane metal-binding protein
MSQTHESLVPATDVKVGSERAFGLVFAAVFVIVGLFPLLGDGGVRFWALGVALAFAVIAFAMPRLLRPLNLVWFRFGLLLHAVVSPLVLGLLFFVTVTPTGLIMRLLGKDLLNLRRDEAAESYWIVREPRGPAPESMKNQF